MTLAIAVVVGLVLGYWLALLVARDELRFYRDENRRLIEQNNMYRAHLSGLMDDLAGLQRRLARFEGNERSAAAVDRLISGEVLRARAKGADGG